MEIKANSIDDVLRLISERLLSGSQAELNISAEENCRHKGRAYGEREFCIIYNASFFKQGDRTEQRFRQEPIVLDKEDSVEKDIEERCQAAADYFQAAKYSIDKTNSSLKISKAQEPKADISLPNSIPYYSVIERVSPLLGVKRKNVENYLQKRYSFGQSLHQTDIRVDEIVEMFGRFRGENKKSPEAVYAALKRYWAEVTKSEDKEISKESDSSGQQHLFE
jgi:hypothetical protein